MVHAKIVRGWATCRLAGWGSFSRYETSLHDRRPWRYALAMLANLDDHFPGRGDRDVRTVDHYMMAAAPGDDATALRTQALQAFLQAVPDRIDCDRFSAPACFRAIRVSRNDHQRNVATAMPFGCC